MKIPDTEVQIHLGCFSYIKNTEISLIEIKHYERGTYQMAIKFNTIVVLLTGVLNFSLGHTTHNEHISKGSIVMIPAKYNCKIEVMESTTLVAFRLNIALHFCDHFSFEMLHREKIEIKKNTHILHVNDVITKYLNYLVTILNDGLHCGYLLEMKLKELLYLLRYYYPMDELKAFFTPILSDDFEFSSLIRKNYLLTSTVNDLAEKVNYSVSGFEKRFKKVFNIPPSHWIQSQKAQVIYHEINCSTKTFAELAYEFGFSSPSHFNNFCKKMFNQTPGDIRKKNKTSKKQK